MAESKGYLSRGLLTLVATITGIAPFVADWNETHIYNPNWPGKCTNPLCLNTLMEYQAMLDFTMDKPCLWVSVLVSAPYGKLGGTIPTTYSRHRSLRRCTTSHSFRRGTTQGRRRLIHRKTFR